MSVSIILAKFSFVILRCVYTTLLNWFGTGLETAFMKTGLSVNSLNRFNHWLVKRFANHFGRWFENGFEAI